MDERALRGKHAVLGLKQGDDVDLSRFVAHIRDAVGLAKILQGTLLKHLLGGQGSIIGEGVLHLSEGVQNLLGIGCGSGITRRLVDPDVCTDPSTVEDRFGEVSGDRVDEVLVVGEVLQENGGGPRRRSQCKAWKAFGLGREESVLGGKERPIRGPEIRAAKQKFGGDADGHLRNEGWQLRMLDVHLGRGITSEQGLEGALCLG